MTDLKNEELQRCERLIDVGNFREAGKIARYLSKRRGELSAFENAELDRFLKIVGIDPFVVAGFLFTLGVIVFLFIKYAL